MTVLSNLIYKDTTFPLYTQTPKLIHPMEKVLISPKFSPYFTMENISILKSVSNLLSRAHARARHARHDFQNFRQPAFLYYNIEKTLKSGEPCSPDFPDLSELSLSPNFYTLLWKNYSLTQQTSYLTPISPFIPPNLHLFYPLHSKFYPNFPFKALFLLHLTNYTPNIGSYSLNSPKYLLTRVYARTRIMRACARVMIF